MHALLSPILNAVLAAIQLISQPPGDIVYFLVTVFALQQAWITVVTFPNNKVRRQRWVWALSLMLLQRAGLIILGLLGYSGIISTLRYMPVLESLIDVTSALLLAWAALFTGQKRKWQTPTLIALLLICLIFAGITTQNWLDITATTPYTRTPFAVIWNWMSIIVMAVTFICAFILKPTGWDWLVGISLFWLLGDIAQFRYPLEVNHISGWRRLASLITHPLMAILVQRFILTVAKPAGPKASAALHSPTINVLHKIQSARDVEPALMVASSDIARLLEAPMCAVLLQPEEQGTEHLRVVAVHPPNAAQLDTPTVSQNDYSLLKTALEDKQVQALRGDEELRSLSPMFSELGITVVDTLVIVPLHHNGRTSGLMLAGDSALAAKETVPDTFGKLGVLLGAAIAYANDITPQGDMMQRVTSNIALATGASALTSQQEKVLNDKIADLTGRLQGREEEITMLNTELQNLTQHTSAFEQQIWQEEIRKLADEREYIEQQAVSMSKERGMLISERDLLTTELETLRNEIDTLTETAETYLAQIDALKKKQSSNAASQSGTVGLLFADENGTIVMADAMVRKLLQFPKGDVIGMPLNGAFADRFWTQAVDTMLSPESEEENTQVSLELNGEFIEAELSSLRGNDKIPDGIAVVLRSSESSAEIFETIINQASEFRTPMTSVLGYTDLLLGEQGGILTNMQRQFLERVKANVEQMTHQLNELVRLTSPDKRPVDISPQPVNLIEIIEEAVMGLAARFRERKLVVQLDLPPELPQVRADRDSLYQIMVQLVSNAALCSEQGTQLVISAHQDRSGGDAYVRISVKDTGSGIAAEDYPRVFRKFYRANQPTIQGMGETGVGMAVAKTLVEANNGRIWVDSVSGEGSTFSFLLPAEAD